jgi:flagellar biosynthesis/type III secretory pathway M-ring protein FliF/YscJ
MALPGGGQPGYQLEELNLNLNLPPNQRPLTEGERSKLEAQLAPDQLVLIENAKTMEDVLAALGMDSEDESIDIANIKTKIDLPLEQIKKLARQRPDTVAMLLKSWIMEDRRS